jgi:hypothetical protein
LIMLCGTHICHIYNDLQNSYNSSGSDRFTAVYPLYKQMPTMCAAFSHCRPSTSSSMPFKPACRALSWTKVHLLTTAANDSEPEVQHGSTNALPLTKRTGTVDQKCQQCLQVVGVGQCWLEKLSECNGADTRSAYCSLQMLEHCCMKQKLNSDSCKCSPWL